MAATIVAWAPVMIAVPTIAGGHRIAHVCPTVVMIAVACIAEIIGKSSLQCAMIRHPPVEMRARGSVDLLIR